jgi:poly(A) polymerase
MRCANCWPQPTPHPPWPRWQAAGVLAAVLPGADARALAPLVHLEDGRAPRWLRRLAVLGGEDVASALRLSRAEERHFSLVRDEIGALRGGPELAFRYGVVVAEDTLLARAALTGTALPPGWDAALPQAAAARCPVTAADLMPALQGAALGAALRAIEDRWIASGFALTRDDLLP